MKTKKKCLELDNEVPKTLEGDLQLLLDEADKIIGKKLNTTDDIIDKLLIINSECSNKLASYILDIKKEIDILNEYKSFSSNQIDDPFITLHSDDDEY